VKIGYITVSIGIAYCLVAQWDGWQSIVKRSDEAMYKAKGNGKNRYCIE
jgi:PleD family two-component response regulator